MRIHTGILWVTNEGAGIIKATANSKCNKNNFSSFLKFCQTKIRFHSFSVSLIYNFLQTDLYVTFKNVK